MSDAPKQPELSPSAASPRKRKAVQASAAAAPPREVERLHEYVFQNQPWRVSRFDLLVGEFESILPEHLPLWHEAISVDARRWQIVRRLFGVRLVAPPMGTDPDDLRTWSRDELCVTLGITSKQLQGELDTARGTWRGRNRPSAEEIVQQTEAPAGDELPLGEADAALLKKYRFNVRLKQDEMEWFIDRVKQFSKILDEDLLVGMARNALNDELQLHRIEKWLSEGTAQVGSVEWKQMINTRAKMAEDYNKLLDKLWEKCPWAGNIAGKYAFKAQVADVTRAIQEWKSRGENALIDGIFTATEVQILCRRSVQAPEPQYRAGAIVYLQAAKAGFWNPDWQNQFPPALLRAITQAWTAAYTAAADAEGLAKPDLEKEGPDGEYPAIYLPDENKAKNQTQTPA